MNRTEAAEYIADQYAEYLDAAGRSATDGGPERNLSRQLDNALVVLGFNRAEVATAVPHDDDAEPFLKLLEYQVLRQVLRDLPQYFDISGDGESFKLSQVRKHAETDLALVSAEILAIFGSLNPGPNGGILVMDLNFETDGAATPVLADGEEEWSA